MVTLAEFQHQYGSKPVDELAQDLAEFFLLLNVVPDESLPEQRSVAETAFQPSQLSRSQALSETLVFPIRKKLGIRGPVIVGRSEANDIVLPHSSISTVHAVFRPADAGGFELLDPGSLNGTYHRTQRLVPRIPVFVASGDRVAFGSGFSGTVQDAEGLLEFLAFLTGGAGS